jgi:Family of unknown function (DUF5362)
MILAKLTHQQVIGTLRATNSTDPDILFAKKEELLSETKRLRLLGVVPLIVGTVLTISLIGAIVGVPMLLVGFSVRKAYKHNIAVTDAALAEYLQSVPSAPRV